MAAIAASDVAYTSLGRGGQINDSGSRVNDLKIVFGDGALTYPAGGIPLSNLSKNGFPNVVDSFLISAASSGDGYVYKYDAVNGKLRIYQSAAGTPSGTVSQATLTMNSYTPAGTNDGGSPPIFTGTPAVLTGSISAQTFTGAAGSAAALSEVSTSFVPAASVTIYATVRGH